MAINPPKNPQAVTSFQKQVASAADRLKQRVAEGAARRSMPEVGTATQADFDAARTRQQQQRVGTATPQARPVAPSSITPAEAQAFQRQNPNFAQANPGAPTIQSAQARSNGSLPAGAAKPGPVDDGLREARERVRANPGVPRGAPSIAEGLAPPNSQPSATRVPVMQRVGGAVRQVGDAVSAAAQRVGLQRVQPLGNKLLDGARATGVAALAGGAISGATTARETGTDVYAKRLGLDPNTQRGVLAETGIRTVGTLQDVGDSILDGLNSVGSFATGGLYNPGSYAEATRRADGTAAPQDAQPAPAAPAAAQPGKVDFSNVQGGTSSYGVTERTAANGGITPVADRAGDPNEVIGTFNGKPITRGASDAMAGAQSFGGPTSIAEGVSDYRAPQGGGGFSAVNPGSGSEQRAKDLLDSNSAAGKLYQQLLQDTTPTGKRNAGQFMETYLNGGTAERGQNVDAGNAATSANAGITRGREGDAAGLEQARIASSKARDGQLQAGEDGALMSILDGIATPVTTKDGKPVRGATKASGNAVLEARKALSEMAAREIGPADGFDTPEDYQAALDARMAAILAEQNPNKKAK